MPSLVPPPAFILPPAFTMPLSLAMSSPRAQFTPINIVASLVVPIAAYQTAERRRPLDPIDSRGIGRGLSSSGNLSGMRPVGGDESSASGLAT